MRLRHPDGSLLHLAYCSNVHPADDLDGVAAQLGRYAARVREQLDVPVLGVGLWVAAPALADAARPTGWPTSSRGSARGRDAERLPVPGLPRAGGEARRLPAVLGGGRAVGVHDRARASCSRACCPTTSRKGASRRSRWAGARAGTHRRRRLPGRARGGRRGGSRSSRPTPAADPARARAGAGVRDRDRRPGGDFLAGLAPEWIGVCLDACHLAVQFEDAGGALARLAEARVPVVKAQVSSALRVEEPGFARGRELLGSYDEPRFLHQVRERVNGHVAGVDDLPEALAGGLPGRREWRVHFHVPVHTREHTTQDELSDTLAALAGGSSPPPGTLRSRPTPGACSRTDHRTTTRWSTGSRASWRGRATDWSRSARRRRHDAGRHRRGRAHPAGARAHAPPLPSRRDGFQARLDPVLPAVTCSVQSTFLTGLTPTDHGIVGNGWYFRDLGEVLLWRQHNALVQGEKAWETARRAKPGYRAANICWWYAMGATTDLTLTPRPVYHADGRKSPDCYTDPPELHDRLTGALGDFPLFQYWGPGAGIASSRWLASAARLVLDSEPLDLMLVYLPHLDYDHQRYGPESPEAAAAARELDEVAGDLVDHARARGDQVVVLSEYGLTPASRPVDVNRALRRAELLRVHTQAGMEYLDPWTSRAFALADHQIAHVYVRDPGMSRARARFSPASRASPSCWKATRRRPPASATPARAIWSRSPSRARGSRTTTGSTTSAPPTSRARSRSTASPATTPPSCSSTPTTAGSRPAPARLSRARRPGSATS